MILLCGIPSEAPLALVREALLELDVPHVMFNQRKTLSTDFLFQVSGGHISGCLSLDGVDHDLNDINGVYVRLMDDRMLPEVRDLPRENPGRERSRNLHEAMYRWIEICPARVVNRIGAMSSNSSKPFQAQLIASQGFFIPETLITNDPDLVRDFHARHGRIIFKSASGVRSIVQELTTEDLSRLDQVRWCPTQFQAFIEGENVRVHVVGEEVFATRIVSEATDYRYARREGLSSELEPMVLDADWSDRCVKLARALGLPLAGIDLKIAPDGAVYCFEVNPSPGFSYYEQSTGQQISRAIARYLSGSS